MTYAKVFVALAIYALALVWFTPPTQADWSFGPHINRPGPHHKNRTRCVAVGWLAYCREGSHSHGDSSTTQDRKSKRRTRCRRLHRLYLVHHPTRAPRALRSVPGCRRWVLDRRYHKNDHNPVLAIMNRIAGG